MPPSPHQNRAGHLSSQQRRGAGCHQNLFSPNVKKYESQTTMKKRCSTRAPEGPERKRLPLLPLGGTGVMFEGPGWKRQHRTSRNKRKATKRNRTFQPCLVEIMRCRVIAMWDDPSFGVPDIYRRVFLRLLASSLWPEHHFLYAAYTSPSALLQCLLYEHVCNEACSHICI